MSSALRRRGRAAASVFAGRGRVFSATVPSTAVLARFAERDEHELVIDPRFLRGRVEQLAGPVAPLVPDPKPVGAPEDARVPALRERIAATFTANAMGSPVAVHTLEACAAFVLALPDDDPRLRQLVLYLALDIAGVFDDYFDCFVLNDFFAECPIDRFLIENDQVPHPAEVERLVDRMLIDAFASAALFPEVLDDRRLP